METIEKAESRRRGRANVQAKMTKCTTEYRRRRTRLQIESDEVFVLVSSVRLVCPRCESKPVRVSECGCSGYSVVVYASGSRIDETEDGRVALRLCRMLVLRCSPWDPVGKPS